MMAEQPVGRQVSFPLLVSEAVRLDAVPSLTVDVYSFFFFFLRSYYFYLRLTEAPLNYSLHCNFQGVIITPLVGLI